MNALRAATIALVIVARLAPALARADDDPNGLIMRGLDLRRAGRSA